MSNIESACTYNYIPHVTRDVLELATSTPINTTADCVCLYCLLAEEVLCDALVNEKIVFKWHAFELRRAPIPNLDVGDHFDPVISPRSVYPKAGQLRKDICLPTLSPQPRTALAVQAFAFA